MNRILKNKAFGIAGAAAVLAILVAGCGVNPDEAPQSAGASGPGAKYVPPSTGKTPAEIAAKRGNVVAQNRLAHVYINALGTAPNPVEAAKWYVLSRRAGLKDPTLEDFYLGLNEEQQKQAIDRANRFRRS